WLAPRRRRSRQGDRPTDRRGVPARAGGSQLRRRGRPEVAVQGRGGRGRGHRLGHPGVLRNLQQRPAGGGGVALYVSVRVERHRPAGAPAPRGIRRGDRGCHRRGVGVTGRPLLGDTFVQHRGPAQGGDVVHRRIGAGSIPSLRSVDFPRSARVGGRPPYPPSVGVPASSAGRARPSTRTVRGSRQVVAYHLPPTTYHLPPTTYHLPPTTPRLPPHGTPKRARPSSSSSGESTENHDRPSSPQEC